MKELIKYTSKIEFYLWLKSDVFYILAPSSLWMSIEMKKKFWISNKEIYKLLFLLVVKKTQAHIDPDCYKKLHQFLRLGRL